MFEQFAKYFEKQNILKKTIHNSKKSATVPSGHQWSVSKASELEAGLHFGVSLRDHRGGYLHGPRDFYSHVFMCFFQMPSERLFFGILTPNASKNGAKIEKK